MAGISHQYQILVVRIVVGRERTAALDVPAQDTRHRDLARWPAFGPLGRILEGLGDEAAIGQDDDAVAAHQRAL